MSLVLCSSPFFESHTQEVGTVPLCFFDTSGAARCSAQAQAAAVLLEVTSSCVFVRHLKAVPGSRAPVSPMLLHRPDYTLTPPMRPNRWFIVKGSAEPVQLGNTSDLNMSCA